MKTLITEVFVSIDGVKYTKLDLHKDESIPMRYTAKDLQSLSKIFSPYSLSFTFPASSRNRSAFGFFGDTDVIKINTESKFATKIYTDGSLSLKGFIQLSKLSYRNQNPTNFTGGFVTSMSNLKDRLGDDKISDLTDADVFVDWTAREVFELLKGAKNRDVDGVNLSYFVPLISNNRVLAFDSNIASSLKDNVSYDVIVDPESTGTIKSSELRPCISFSTIIELIKIKYDLDVVAPLDLRKEYADLVVWCNAENMFNPKDTRLTILDSFGSLKAYDTKNESGIPDPKKYVSTVNNFSSEDHFKVVKRTSPFTNENEYTEYFTMQTRFEGVVVTGGSTDPKVNLKIFRQGTDEMLISKQFALVDGEFDCEIQIPDGLFIADEIQFYITAQFEQATSWTNCFYRTWFRYYDGKTGWLSSKEYATYAYDSEVNDNSAAVSGTQIDLFKSLPDIKIADFLASYFKMFNISVFDTSPNDDKLFWLTPEDIKSEGLAYSRAVLDYTPYANVKTYAKETSSDFNYYNFKHADSNYKSNIDYLSAAGLGYGQTVYPAVKPSNPLEFKVETIFSLMVPVLLFGSDDIITYYGFDGDVPEILDTGESRYSPNYGELTIFYNNGNRPLVNSLGYQNVNGGGGLYNAVLDNYMLVLPFNTESQSLAFSVLVELGVQYPESLYKKYYQAQTERLLDPNVLSQDFELILPPAEMYLNEATTIQGGGATPLGFRLQNDIIIGEDIFTIIDATIDQTTGKTKLTLLNY